MSSVARSSLADVSKRPFGRRASGRTGSSFLLMGLAVDGLALASQLLAHRGAPSKPRPTRPRPTSGAFSSRARPLTENLRSRAGEFHQTLDRVHLVLELLQRLRAWAAGRPVEQLNGVHHRDLAAALQLGDAADIAGGDEVRPHARDVVELSLAQLAGKLRLQKIVGSCRAAADMPLGHVEHGITGLREQRAGLVADLLAVLERAGRVIGDAEAGPGERREQPKFIDELGDVTGKPRHLGGE